MTPEEDWEVPGTYQDAMKAGTKLGKAVAGACDELATLGTLVGGGGQAAAGPGTHRTGDEQQLPALSQQSRGGGGGEHVLIGPPTVGRLSSLRRRTRC